ncbi:FAD assembly factor SdhE [Psychrobacter lutiphocae]|uniref:FAD assembly factor SdhE n=1 Tax=Psychrobacter lutiphocae TaxID=540500 RepID=UPI000379F902|nr:succinate dehydrogenase assembly factor 2 [Psychrobacter lutiphocae]
MSTQPEPTNEQRRVIYQARRGLKELDFYIDPYVKQHYLTADTDEQATFAKLLTYEDPDLLNFFMNQDTPEDTKVAELIVKLKSLQYD